MLSKRIALNDAAQLPTSGAAKPAILPIRHRCLPLESILLLRIMELGPGKLRELLTQA